MPAEKPQKALSFQLIPLASSLASWQTDSQRCTTKAQLPQFSAGFILANVMSPKPSFLSDLQQRIHEVVQRSPAADVEKNLKAMLNQGFAKLDLLTREEFENQSEVLARTRAKLDALEARVAELESRQKS